jgi:hypothetical protein
VELECCIGGSKGPDPGWIEAFLRLVENRSLCSGAGRCQFAERKVLQEAGAQVCIPVLNHLWRSAELTWVNVSGFTRPERLLLDPVVADRGHGVDRLGDLLAADLACGLGAMAPHARVAIGLQLEPHRERAARIGALLLWLPDPGHRAGEILHPAARQIGSSLLAGFSQTAAKLPSRNVRFGRGPAGGPDSVLRVQSPKGNGVDVKASGPDELGLLL